MKYGVLAVAVLATAGSALADIVQTNTSFTKALEGRARYGATGFEQALYNESGSNSGTQSNYPGNQALFNRSLSFQFTYVAATGTSTWSIDADSNGDFLGSGTGWSETLTRTDGVAGRTYGQVRLYLQAAWSSSSAYNNASVTGLTINGTSLGDFTTDTNGAIAGQLLTWQFTDTSGQFGAGGDITVTGTFLLSGIGAFSQERPTFHIETGNGQQLQVVPLPPAAWAGISSLAGVAGIGLIRCRRISAA